jgi:hypothetical protein
MNSKKDAVGPWIIVFAVVEGVILAFIVYHILASR